MASAGSVTLWLRQLLAGDPIAAQKLWEHYFAQLLHLARKKLRGTRRRAADEEDVAQIAFNSFCRGLACGRFPRLHDRNSLWALLVRITERKAFDLAQHERRQKRGGGLVVGESAIPSATPDDSKAEHGLDQIISREPTPKFAAQIAEEVEQRLAQLGAGDLRAIALWKLEGYTNAEIAAKLGCVEGTVERKLRAIRTIWSKETNP
jgi:RNA polymerase sigma factor (sigma-70 family)